MPKADFVRHPLLMAGDRMQEMATHSVIGPNRHPALAVSVRYIYPA